MTGSTDKTAKFWDFELIAGPEGNKILSLVHRRTLQLDEGVTCLALSQDGRLLAVGLLDSTVKVGTYPNRKNVKCCHGSEMIFTTLSFCPYCQKILGLNSAHIRISFESF